VYRGGWCVGLCRGYSSRRVQRAADSTCAVAEDVGVDHGRRHVAVAWELLAGADAVAVLQKVGCEGMAEGVASGTLVDAGRANGAGHAH
jgi:hypothetical protein